MEELEKLKIGLSSQSEHCISYVKILTDELLYTARTEIGRAKRIQTLNKIAKVLFHFQFLPKGITTHQNQRRCSVRHPKSSRQRRSRRRL